MTVSLGGIALHDSLTLPGIRSRMKIAVSAQMTILGRQTVQTAPAQTGGEIILAAEGGESRMRGYFTTAQVASIEALEAAGAAVTLVHHLGTWTVVIVRKDLTAIDNFLTVGGDDLYVGTVTMIEV